MILEGASGQGGQGTILYVAEVGSVGRVHVAHGGASAQTFDATVRIALPDPSIDAVASDPDWSRVFSGDIWGAMFDGTYWWTTSAADATVAKRDALGVSLSSFSAMLAKARGITFDGTYIWVAGDDTPNGNEEIGKYQTDGTHVSTLVTGPSSEGNDGIAWDGSHLWLIEGGSSKAEKYTTAGSLVSSFSLPGSGWQGVAVYDGDLFIVNRTAAALSRYTPAGALVDTIDISGAGAAPTGVWIAADGTLYIAVDGDGLHQRDTKIGA